LISRITDQMLLTQTQANLQTQLSQLSVLQNESSSQQAISKPSDNPTGMAMSLALKSQQAANAQYSSNASDALNWLTSINSSLTSATSAMQQVRSLVVQASNTGALSSSAKATIITQLQGYKAQLLSQANTTYLGRPVFAGNSDSGAAFDDTSYSYNGTAGSTVTRTIGQGTNVSVSGDGAATFGTGTDSVFALIDTITNDIQSGGNPSSTLTDIDSRISAISTQQSAISASFTQVQQGQAVLTAQATSLTTQRNSVDNVDLTKTLVELTAQQNAYQAALGVTSKALQPTLMSFLS
jgi:flagellar hook-associated protein 3 FlgL